MIGENIINTVYSEERKESDIKDGMFSLLTQTLVSNCFIDLKSGKLYYDVTNSDGCNPDDIFTQEALGSGEQF